MIIIRGQITNPRSVKLNIVPTPGHMKVSTRIYKMQRKLEPISISTGPPEHVWRSPILWEKKCVGVAPRVF